MAGIARVAAVSVSMLRACVSAELVSGTVERASASNPDTGVDMHFLVLTTADEKTLYLNADPDLVELSSGSLVEVEVTKSLDGDHEQHTFAPSTQMLPESFGNDAPWYNVESVAVQKASSELSVSDAAANSRLRGEKTILILRILTPEGNCDYCDEACARDLIFGEHMQYNVQPTLDRATREASHGQMWFNEAQSRVLTVSIPDHSFALPCNFGEIGIRARGLAKEVHGVDADSFDFVYHLLPSNFGCWFGGVAYLPGAHAWSAPGYARNGIVKHEVGQLRTSPPARIAS